MTYPVKFRQHVLAVKAAEALTNEQTSKRFVISIRTLFRWQKQLAPCTTRQKPATKLDMAKLAKDVETYPDAYQWERAKRLGVARRTVGDGLKRAGLSVKKNPSTSTSR